MSNGINYDKFISREDSKRAVLQGMLAGKQTYDADRRGLPTSGVAYLAYPGYRFRSPQGAALAVGKLVRLMREEGLLSHSFGGGYYLTRDGVKAAMEVAVVETDAKIGSENGNI